MTTTSAEIEKARERAARRRRLEEYPGRLRYQAQRAEGELDPDGLAELAARMWPTLARAETREIVARAVELGQENRGARHVDPSEVPDLKRPSQREAELMADAKAAVEIGRREALKEAVRRAVSLRDHSDGVDYAEINAAVCGDLGRHVSRAQTSQLARQVLDEIAAVSAAQEAAGRTDVAAEDVAGTPDADATDPAATEPPTPPQDREAESEAGESDHRPERGNGRRPKRENPNPEGLGPEDDPTAATFTSEEREAIGDMVFRSLIARRSRFAMDFNARDDGRLDLTLSVQVGDRTAALDLVDSIFGAVRSQIDEVES